ncbi:MAG TPA: alpha/beta fold hydrolase, partial [Kofleriaceae bacterium]|nr:alpha/beta fold hydrolase [Kofleriaceae bacterium]
MKSVMSIVLAACFLVAAPGAASAAECRSSFLPVDLQLPLPLPQLAWLVDPLQPRLLGERVFVRMCLPDGPTPETVLLLLHGITYTHAYWDLVDPTGGTDRYSFVASATGAGYATLAIDRIGIGQSSHPLSALIDMNQNVFVVHQVVQALRDGDISGPDGDVDFSKVVLVGHSYGSMISWFEASRFQDVDG